jgi:hypothetical protein
VILLFLPATLRNFEVTTLQFALIFETILAVKAVVGSIIVTGSSQALHIP